MRVKDFEKKIKHLTQTQILTGAGSSLNKLLVDKGIITEEELQSYFLDWMQQQEKDQQHKKSKNK